MPRSVPWTRPIGSYPSGNDFPLPWATWIPGRRPEFYVHNDLGAAKLALAGHPMPPSNEPNMYEDEPVRGGVLYQVEGGTWVVRAVVQPGTFKREHIMYNNPKKWNRKPGITTVIKEHAFS